MTLHSIRIVGNPASSNTPNLTLPWHYHGRKVYDQSRKHIKKQRHYFANKSPSSQSYGFSSSHVWMWELDYKESWVLKNWCFWTVVSEKILESPMDCKEIQPVHSKGNQSWIFIGRTDAEAETPVFWPSDAKNWLIGKDPHTGKDWRQEEKGMTEEEMVGWHHRLNGHEFEQALGVGDGQGGLVCYSPWSCKESHTTERWNWTELIMGRGVWRATVHRGRGHDQSNLAHTHSLLSYICSCIVCNILVKQSFQAICYMES